MSAFIMEDKTINRILSYMVADDDLKHYLPALGIDLTDDKLVTASATMLGRAMMAMNCAAFNSRYGEGEAERELGDNRYNFQSISAPSKFQAASSLRCFLYQCSEGDIPNRLLFKAISDYADALAWSIVRDTPEYKNAEWG